jgi:RNA polymerase primary sigma factor
MRTQDVLDADGPRHWFLDMPEAQVMSAARERELLLELAECRRGLLLATRRPDGSEWDLSRPDAEFRRAVRGLTDDHGPGGAATPGDGAGPSDGPGALAAPHLARRYEEIRGALAMANSRLVAYIARRYLNRGISPSDLLQEGFCGLLEAIDRFDPVNTTRLATYASWWIRQAIQRAIADGSYAVRLTPRQLRRLAQSLPKNPDPAGKADSTPPLTPRVGQPAPVGDRQPASWQELAAIRPRVSLDAVSRFDESTPLAEILAFIPDPDHEHDEQAESVDSLLAALNPREQLIVKLRFGLDGQPRHSLSQIGAVLAVSKERVRQIQDRALRKLRDAAATPGQDGR